MLTSEYPVPRFSFATNCLATCVQKVSSQTTYVHRCTFYWRLYQSGPVCILWFLIETPAKYSSESLNPGILHVQLFNAQLEKFWKSASPRLDHCHLTCPQNKSVAFKKFSWWTRQRLVWNTENRKSCSLEKSCGKCNMNFRNILCRSII